MSQLQTQAKLDLPTVDDFKQIVLNNTPLIDVRAPVEFEKGAFEQAVNLPLMNDEERRLVGIKYKEEGNDAAVKLGHQLVNETVRQPRIEAWKQFIAQYPDAFIYCFRGGQRSQISQRWLQENGVNIPRLAGGYKAFRSYLIDTIDEMPQVFESGIKPIVLAGRTGVGKTIVLNQLDHSIDLEGLANHRGSSFGRHVTAQPTQINFENNLAMALIRQLEKKPSFLLFEDESRNVGCVNIPLGLMKPLQQADRIRIEISLDERVEITLEEYVNQSQKEFTEALIDMDGIEAWQKHMMDALQRIKKRLGGELFKRVSDQFIQACTQQKHSQSVDAHRAWIETLLSQYYDPMYDYQLQKQQAPTLFTGNHEEVKAFLASL